VGFSITNVLQNNKNKFMRNIHYNLKSFRLSKKTIDNLKRIKKETGLTYNLIISEMIKIYLKELKKRRKAKNK
jgi:predicted DNA-binding protein